MTNQEAIEALDRIFNYCEEIDLHLPKEEQTGYDMLVDINIIRKALVNQKTGHWIELGCVGNDNYDFECSECHHTDTQSKTGKVNYCWYCGAKMVESPEETNKDNWFDEMEESEAEKEYEEWVESLDKGEQE